eukprot:SAG31_NODE_862_length_11416_cov_8.600336_2_plen_319_part_00
MNTPTALATVASSDARGRDVFSWLVRTVDHLATEVRCTRAPNPAGIALAAAVTVGCCWMNCVEARRTAAEAAKAQRLHTRGLLLLHPTALKLAQKLPRGDSLHPSWHLSAVTATTARLSELRRIVCEQQKLLAEAPAGAAQSLVAQTDEDLSPQNSPPSTALSTLPHSHASVATSPTPIGDRQNRSAAAVDDALQLLEELRRSDLVEEDTSPDVSTSSSALRPLLAHAADALRGFQEKCQRQSRDAPDCDGQPVALQDATGSQIDVVNVRATTLAIQAVLTLAEELGRGPAPPQSTEDTELAQALAVALADISPAEFY